MPASTRGCVLPRKSEAEVRRLLAERSQLADRLASLDADSERLARAVQRVGGADGHVRRFTGAPPQLISSSAELHHRLEALSKEMQDLTATISANELELQDLDLPSRRRRVFGTVMLLLLIAAAVGAGIYLAVR